MSSSAARPSRLGGGGALVTAGQNPGERAWTMMSRPALSRGAAGGPWFQSRLYLPAFLVTYLGAVKG